MFLVTPEEIQALDQQSCSLGVPTRQLMRRAGEGAYNFLSARVPFTPGTKAILLCGKGNNGGDGFVLASHLKKKIETEVILFGRKEDLKGDARWAFQEYVKRKGKVNTFQGRLPETNFSIVVDALLGTGAKGELKSPYRSAVRWINEQRRQGATILALDIPTGVDGKTGKIAGEAVQAHLTATFGFAKTGLFLYPGRKYCGEIKVVDIGYPETLKKKPFLCKIFDREELQKLWKKRDPFSHKGDYGRVMVVGGQKGMTGAVTLACRAAYRTGAGLVYAVVPENCIDIVDQSVIEAVTLSLSEKKWRKLVQRQDAIICGCGMGVGKEQKSVLRYLLAQKKKLVVDADGLNNLASMRASKKNATCVFTPHPLEAARLLKKEVETLLADPVETARQLALQLGGIAVFKTYPVLVSDGQHVFFLTQGNPGMATGGMGDVLSGAIGTCLAQINDLLTAAAAGVFFLQKAGDKAKKEKGEAGLIASDVVEKLPFATDALYGSL